MTQAEKGLRDGGMDKLLGVVILNYNGADDTLACVSCFPEDAIGFKLVVVDNASTDDSFERLDKSGVIISRSYCELIQSGDNLGYAGGNNVGIKRALECGCSHICLLNNDTILDPDSLNILADFLEENTDCAFVGPVLLEADGSNQIVQSAGANINLWTGDVSLRFHGARRRTLSGSYECDYIGGACLMFRAKDIDDLGLIPECYFLFFEETEWCLRAARAGKKVVCCADASVVHKGSASINKISGLSGYMLARNTMRFEMRNASRTQAITCFAYNAAYYILKSLVRHDGSIKRIGYLMDGMRNVVREPYRTVVRLCEG